ncbi:hypothetical protein PR048_015555 [Dryococelus australis]|uniref:Uncharacterized protein n=1 Tax=Dryococelus australis TaxID=614101 RepID=A0ABQ9HHT3_9NEOP|nr:hypothetical protein PR048_015555 [Dryococelus australis]
MCLFPVQFHLHHQCSPPFLTQLSTSIQLAPQENVQSSSLLNKFKIENSVTEAEVLWYLHTVIEHNSLKNAEHSVELFKKMFPDSVINSCDIYVIGFNESLNKVPQKQQLDLSIHYWDETKNQVSVLYFSCFPFSIKSCGHMEWYIGRCATVAGGRDVWSSCNSWSIQNCHKEDRLGFVFIFPSRFKDNPTCRGIYTAVTNSLGFPKKFFAVCWVENVEVSKRNQSTLPNLNKYPSSSFKVISKSLHDELLQAKLAFFQLLAADLEPFLREFQSMPYLYGKNCERIFHDHCAIASNRFFKKRKWSYSNLKNAKDVDLGYATCAAIRKCKGVK